MDSDCSKDVERQVQLLLGNEGPKPCCRCRGNTFRFGCWLGNEGSFLFQVYYRNLLESVGILHLKHVSIFQISNICSHLQRFVAKIHAECSSNHFQRHHQLPIFFSTEKSLHREFLHTEVFIQRCFYTEKSLHREVFTRTSFYTEKSLQGGAFTRSGKLKSAAIL